MKKSLLISTRSLRNIKQSEIQSPDLKGLESSVSACVTPKLRKVISATGFQLTGFSTSAFNSPKIVRASHLVQVPKQAAKTHLKSTSNLPKITINNRKVPVNLLLDKITKGSENLSSS